MKQLTGLDAGFLTLETPGAPMSIAGISILDPNTPDGRLDVVRFREHLRTRLGATVALRRRLASTPLDLARPYWVELDPGDVDLEHHVELTELPEPGGEHELCELMAWELSQPLDRDRPLWQFLFVEGVRSITSAPEAIAIIGRIHHAAVDGVSGAEILAALFDAFVSPESPDFDEREEPKTLELLTQARRDLGRSARAAPRLLGKSLLGLAGAATSRLRRGPSPPLPFEAPKASFNRPISPRRSWAPVFFDLERIKAVKRPVDATVNDVVLAICAGALRGWLVERDELPEAPLVAMVPVSVRGRDERGSAGNLVSAMLVSLATDVDEPVERLHAIRDAARAAKDAHQAVGARTLVEAADLLPFALSGLATRLYTRWHLAEQHRPPFNLVITNVPGPSRPLTIGGARLLAHAGAAPLFDGLGLLLAVFSYAGRLSVGVTLDREIGDAEPLATGIRTALEELEATLGLS